MSNNLEIVMDIDTLDIFDVIDLDETNHFKTGIDEDLPEEKEISSYDDLNKTWLGNRYHYKLSGLLWEIIENDIIHDLSPRNKHGTSITTNIHEMEPGVMSSNSHKKKLYGLL
ncbi:Uncharacterised protein [Streptococcus dysgalactiae subsp. equisimilis]|nr:Uncharacterised protein [Streptococcus dysgalactiae subsp. equisimilis]